MPVKNLRPHINRIMQKVDARQASVIQKVAFEVYRRVTEKSPVGNPDLWKGNKGRKRSKGKVRSGGYVGGRFRGNWQLGIGVRPAGSIDRISPGTTGTVPTDLLTEETLKLAQIAAPVSVFVVNNLPYAQRIENGHSTQAPAGVVAVTVAEIKAEAPLLVKAGLGLGAL